MIDWMTIRAPLKTTSRNIVRLIDKETGESREFPQRIKLGGEDEANRVRVSIVRKNSQILISGNPIKFLTGQNLIGVSDVLTLGYVYLKRIAKDLGIRPTEQELKQWRAGNYWLTRIDVAGYVKLPSAVIKSRVIKHLRLLFAARNDILGPSYPKQSVSVINPRRKRFSVYDKSCETDRYRAVPDALAGDVRLTGLIDKYLRVELRLLSKELKDLNLQNAYRWRGVSVHNLLAEEILRQRIRGKVNFAESIVDANLPNALKRVVEEWMGGIDVLEHVGRTTRHKYINKLADLGIDIEVPYKFSEISGLDLGAVFSPDNLVVGHPKWLGGWPPIARIIQSVK